MNSALVLAELDAHGVERSCGATPAASPLGPRALGFREARVRSDFEMVYETHFDFVWRSARRLGIGIAHVDDVVQDVFVVVHRRLPEFEGRSSIQTWLFAITMRVARDHRRNARRKGEHTSLFEAVLPSNDSPMESAARAEAIAFLYRFLDTLDDDKRAIFVLAELEQVPVTEIAESLGVNPNTARSRLREARARFEKAIARENAKNERSLP